MALERFFAWLDRALSGSAGDAPSGFLSAVGGPSPVPAPQRPAHEPLPTAALLSVDGGGQLLLWGADRLTLGHQRSGRADLGFLADVGPLHAVLERADSLQDGPGWRLAPASGEVVRIDGRPVGMEGQRLATGARVALGENLEFRVHVPDAASAAVLLELRRGAECAGARQVVLMALGPGGRVRIGADAAAHVRVPGLAFGLVLEWRGRELCVSSEHELSGAIRGSGGSLPFPPRSRLVLSCGRPRGSRPPFELSLEPVERLDPGSAAR